MYYGLTMVVGPSGSGKTDVAVLGENENIIGDE